MAAYPTIPETIVYADISTGLCANYNAAGALWGKRVIPPASPMTIAIVTDALRWGSDGGAQDAETLRNIRNYLLWLIGMFGMDAKRIVNGGGGGSVVPGGGVGYIYTENSVTISADSSTYQNDNMVLGTQLSFVVLNNQLLTTANGDFTFDTTTGTLTFITVSLFIDDTLTIPFNRKL
jgi:hypothetical protein